VSCGKGGAFEFRDVPPGDYYVMAFDRVKWSREADTSLATLTRSAARVRVDKNSVDSIQLSVIRWPD
jgi:hypothetical protein